MYTKITFKLSYILKNLHKNYIYVYIGDIKNIQRLQKEKKDEQRKEEREKK